MTQRGSNGRREYKFRRENQQRKQEDQIFSEKMETVQRRLERSEQNIRERKHQ
jgi:hypothetical protein